MNIMCGSDALYLSFHPVYKLMISASLLGPFYKVEADEETVEVREGGYEVSLERWAGSMIVFTNLLDGSTIQCKHPQPVGEGETSETRSHCIIL